MTTQTVVKTPLEQKIIDIAQLHCFGNCPIITIDRAIRMLYTYYNISVSPRNFRKAVMTIRQKYGYPVFCMPKAKGIEKHGLRWASNEEIKAYINHYWSATQGMLYQLKVDRMIQRREEKSQEDVFEQWEPDPDSIGKALVHGDYTGNVEGERQ